MERDDSGEFVNAIQEALKDNGVYDKLTCQARSEILSVLKNPQDSEKHQKNIDYHSQSANFLINELIKEYLDYNGYKHTSDVLSVESQQSMARSERNDLEKALNIHSGPNAKQVPLLYAIVSNLRSSS